MSGRTRHLRLLESPPPEAIPTPPQSTGTSVAFLHRWRAAQIARSRAMHPSNLARAAASPALRPLN